MNRGTVTERKAAIETLIHEVPLTPQGAVPVFKVPLRHDDAPTRNG